MLLPIFSHGNFAIVQHRAFAVTSGFTKTFRICFPHPTERQSGITVGASSKNRAHVPYLKLIKVLPVDEWLRGGDVMNEAQLEHFGADLHRLCIKYSTTVKDRQRIKGVLKAVSRQELTLVQKHVTISAQSAEWV